MKREFIDEWEEFAYQDIKHMEEKSCFNCKYRPLTMEDYPCSDCNDMDRWKGFDVNEQKA